MTSAAMQAVDRGRLPQLLCLGLLSRPDIALGTQIENPVCADACYVQTWIAEAALLCVQLMAVPFARYSVPFRPVTFTLAVFFILWLYRHYRELRREQRPAAISHG